MKTDFDFTDGLAAANPITHSDEVITPSLGESYVAGLGSFIDEEMSISSFINGNGIKARNDLLKSKLDSGEIPQDVYQSALVGDGDRLVDWNYIAKQAKELGHNDVMTDADLYDDLREELKTKREYSADVYDRSGALGTAAYFLGNIHAAAMDPINVIGGAAIPTRSWQAMAIAKRFASVGAANMATESAIQPLVYDWKKSIDSPYTTKEALMNIGFAGLGGIAFEGIEMGAAKALSRNKAAKAVADIRAEVEADTHWREDPDKAAVVRTLEHTEKEYNNLSVVKDKATGEIKVDHDNIIEAATQFDDFAATQVGRSNAPELTNFEPVVKEINGKPMDQWLADKYVENTLAKKETPEGFQVPKKAEGEANITYFDRVNQAVKDLPNKERVKASIVSEEHAVLMSKADEIEAKRNEIDNQAHGFEDGSKEKVKLLKQSEELTAQLSSVKGEIKKITTEKPVKTPPPAADVPAPRPETKGDTTAAASDTSADIVADVLDMPTESKLEMDAVDAKFQEILDKNPDLVVLSADGSPVKAADAMAKITEDSDKVESLINCLAENYA